MRAIRFAASTGCWLVWLAGCQSSTPVVDVGSEDGQQIVALIDSLSDEAHDRTKLKSAFSSDCKLSPREMGRYTRYQYAFKGRPQINGNTATCTVVLTPITTGEDVEKEWSFVKEGSQWKIQSAPLP